MPLFKKKKELTLQMKIAQALGDSICIYEEDNISRYNNAVKILFDISDKEEFLKQLDECLKLDNQVRIREEDEIKTFDNPTVILLQERIKNGDILKDKELFDSLKVNGKSSDEALETVLKKRQNKDELNESNNNSKTRFAERLNLSNKIREK